MIVITAMDSMPAYDKTSKADRRISALLYCDLKPPTAQKRAKITAVLAIVTISSSLTTCWARNQSLHDSSGMTQCVIVRVRPLGRPAGGSGLALRCVVIGRGIRRARRRS
jgi:hypothetical protein